MRRVEPPVILPRDAPDGMFNRADRTPLRLLYLFASAGKAYSTGNSGDCVS